MRKLFVMMFVCLVVMASLSGCSLNTYVVKANYDVCYPDGTKNYDDEALIESKDTPIVVCYSYDGTNYVSAVTSAYTGTYGVKEKGVSVIKSTTAPMRLNSFDVTKTKRNVNKNVSRYDGY